MEVMEVMQVMEVMKVMSKIGASLPRHPRERALLSGKNLAASSDRVRDETTDALGIEMAAWLSPARRPRQGGLRRQGG